MYPTVRHWFKQSIMNNLRKQVLKWHKFNQTLNNLYNKASDSVALCATSPEI